MTDYGYGSLLPRLQRAWDARQTELSSLDQHAALRLFNGFYEAEPTLVVDLFASTLLIWDHSPAWESRDNFLAQVQDFYLDNLPSIDCVVRKIHLAPDAGLRNGLLTYGQAPVDKVREHGVWYALDLRMQQDTSFDLDTRYLRRWLLEHAAGWEVLNTFAYTGSLGVAALAGGASRVLQTDRSRKFLDLARRSALLNALDQGRMGLSAMDFFSQVARLKRSGELFDCVILDPPFFSATSKGTVDLVNESVRLINKVRPLIRDGGRLVAVNNALYLSGTAYYRSLEALCQDGYLEIETILPVPSDITGYPQTVVDSPPADPAPFNHATKIAVLRVRRR